MREPQLGRPCLVSWCDCLGVRIGCCCFCGRRASGIPACSSRSRRLRGLLPRLAVPVLLLIDPTPGFLTAGVFLPLSVSRRSLLLQSFLHYECIWPHGLKSSGPPGSVTLPLPSPGRDTAHHGACCLSTISGSSILGLRLHARGCDICGWRLGACSRHHRHRVGGGLSPELPVLARLIRRDDLHERVLEDAVMEIRHIDVSWRGVQLCLGVCRYFDGISTLGLATTDNGGQSTCSRQSVGWYGWTHQTVCTWRVANVHPIAAVVGIEVFTSILVETTAPASAHDGCWFRWVGDEEFRAVKERQGSGTQRTYGTQGMRRLLCRRGGSLVPSSGI